VLLQHYYVAVLSSGQSPMLQTLHFLCVMRVFDVRASSSSPKLPLCQISFLWQVATCWANYGEKSRTQSLTHSVTHPTYLMSREPKRLHFGTSTDRNNQ